MTLVPASGPSCAGPEIVPGRDGPEAASRISGFPPRTRVLALSMHKDRVSVREILRAGARGDLLKDAFDAGPTAAVRAVARSGGYIAPSVADSVLADYRQQVSDPVDLPASRERGLLQLIAEGKTHKEISAHLNLSVYTVDAHRGRIMEKLSLHSAGEPARFALCKGLID